MNLDLKVMRTAEEIIVLIREAFSGVERPKKEDLLHCPVDELWVESFLDDIETDWVDIDPKKIEYECSALTAFSPAAWRYYLPAYMTWNLRNYATSDSNTVDHVIYGLELDDDPKIRDSKKPRFEALSRKQAEAVLAFLDFMSQDGMNALVDAKVARRAIDSYWHKFKGK